MRCQQLVASSGLGLPTPKLTGEAKGKISQAVALPLVQCFKGKEYSLQSALLEVVEAEKDNNERQEGLWKLG